jgi:hypothetical protein
MVEMHDVVADLSDLLELGSAGLPVSLPSRPPLPVGRVTTEMPPCC